MQVGDVFRECITNLDVQTALRCWASIAPDMPRPENDADALIALHYARTITKSIPARLRFYSHHWLLDRNLPSGLPDHLKPKAERAHPRIVEAVGVSVKAMSAASIPLAKAIESAMSNAVADCYANGDTHPLVVRALMEDARRKVMAA